MWVRVHNLPVDDMHDSTGVRMGNTIGNFVRVIKNKDGSCPGSFMRVSVLIDITKPLRWIVKVRLDGDRGSIVWGNLQYERVPDFCCACSRIGHGIRECPLPEELKSMESGDFPYGPILRVSEVSRGCGRGNVSLARSGMSRKRGSVNLALERKIDGCPSQDRT